MGAVAYRISSTFYLPLLAAALLCSEAHAASVKVLENASLPRTQFVEPEIKTEDPVLLDATQIDYDHENEVAIATGNVEIVQGPTVLLADQLIYDKKRNIITAHGNISVMDSTGAVYFAEDLELKNDMKSGVINQFKSRLIDDSVMTAVEARKVDDNVTELTRAVYSPCKVKSCKNTKEEDPLWQLRARHVTVDQKEEEITYDDAYLEVYGVPVFYTPYLSHATPGAGNESGLLIPEYSHTSNLGSVYKQPIYYSISPDKDVTITPIILGEESPVMAGEYRQMFNSGSMKFDGSITNPRARDGLGNSTSGNDLRGHLDAKGEFKFNEDAGWGFDVRRTSDDTYLRRYNFSQDTLLTSRAYVEKFRLIGDNERSYGIVQGVSFQGLTIQDQGKRIPFALPLADFTYESAPGVYNSRWSMDGNAMLLHRENGAQSRRISNTVGWKLPYITEGGQVLELNTELRGDIYSVDDVALTNGNVFNGQTGRLVPQASLLWRYPFINQLGNSSVMVEPVVNFVVSPGGGNTEKIPNEDSLVPEFTDSNLFSSNRFAGYDRVESGPRVSYGLRGQVDLDSDKYVDWLFGQNYRTQTDRNFPFSNDLDSHFSDYVGKVGVNSEIFSMAYRFRLEKESLSPKRNEFDAGINYDPVAFAVSYLSLNNDPVLATKEVVSGAAMVALTDKWSLLANGNKDLDSGQVTNIYGGVNFKNECINLSTVLGRDYTHDRDVKSSTNFLIKISLKNLN